MNPPKLFVEAGERIGRGVVIDPEIRVGKRGDRGARLRCDCSTVYEAQLSHLFRGAVKSCGCQRRELSAKRPHLPARRLFAQEGLGQLVGEKPFADAGGPCEEIGVRQPATSHRVVECLDQAIMPSNSLPSHFDIL